MIDVYEALEGFKLSMNGYYDMKEDAAIPFYLTLTDEQTNTVNEGNGKHGKYIFQIGSCETF